MATKIRCVKAKLEDLTQDGSYLAYASIFGNVDSDGDIIEKGAFKKTLKKTKGAIPLVWFHNPREPLGLAKGEEDARGLLIHGQLNLDSQKGAETYAFMKQGVVGDHSFAFDIIKDEFIRDEENGNITGRAISEVKLFEASPLVNGFAANDQANLIALKWRENHQGQLKDMTFDDLIKELMASHGDEFNEKYRTAQLDGKKIAETVDSGAPLDVDSIEKAKEMGDIIAHIKGLTSNINQFCERR